MLSLCRLSAKSSRIVSTVARRSQRTLVLSSKACQQDLSQIRPAVETRDLLRKSISDCRSLEQLHTALQQHLRVMNDQHLLDCMTQYMRLAKEEGPDFSAMQDPAFNSLAGTVLLRLRFFDANQCVHLARIAANLKLDCSSSFVQGIYQMLRKKLNEIDLRQIMMLQRYVNQLSGSSVLTETVKFSLPLVFETHVKQQLDRSDMQMCLNALKFASAYNVNETVQAFVATEVSKYISELTPEAAAQVLYGNAFRDRLIGTTKNTQMRRLLVQCMAILGENLPFFDHKSVRRILAAYNLVGIFSAELEDALWATAPSATLREVSTLVAMSLKTDSFTLKKAALLKKSLSQHIHEMANEATYVTVRECCKVMALLAAQSPQPDGSFEELGLAFAKVHERYDPQQQRPGALLSFLLDLAILGVYPERELDLVFSEDWQKSMTDFNFSHFEQLFFLERCLRDNFGEGCAYAVTPELKDLAAKQRLPTLLDHNLEEALKTGLGGDEFLMKRLMTPSGVEADFAVAMRQGEYPIALAQKQDPLQDLPKDCKVVAILQGIPKRDYASKAPDMSRTLFALRQRDLRAQNLYAVCIRLDKWSNLPYNEKIPFIMREIKEVLREGRPHEREETGDCL